MKEKKREERTAEEVVRLEECGRLMNRNSYLLKIKTVPFFLFIVLKII